MSGTTSVPTISFTAVGFIIPLESAIVTGLNSDFNAAFGGNLNVAPNTPQGQLIASTAAILGDCNDQLVSLFNSVDPAYAFGRMQDAIARIYFLERLPAQSTELTVLCTGLPGVVIPQVALIIDTSQNLYYAPSGGTIDAGGTVSVQFLANNTGPTPVPSSGGVSIYQSVPGWDSVSVISGDVGNIVESKTQFEIRRKAAVAANATGFLPAILGTILQVPDVIDVFVTENFTNSTDSVSYPGVPLNPNSLYACVAGGDPNAIAAAIWAKKNPGCGYTGNTTITVFDNNSGYQTPPSYAVSFQIPIGAPICFNVTILGSTFVPSNAAQLIQAAIQSGFTGADTGPRARIGSLIFASRYYSDVAALGSWVQIISIQIGCGAVGPTPPAPSNANFNATIAGTALTVSGGVTGTIAVGQFVFGLGVQPGTIIVSGSGSSWVVSVTQTVTPAVAMTSAAATNNDVQMQINWLPTLQNADVNVIIQ